MLTENINNRRPYYDTGPIPRQSLSQKEQSIIFEISRLLMEIKTSAEHLPKATRKNSSSIHSVWATTTPKLNNVILLDGERGVGKTSLLLTLIEALSNPLKWNKAESDNKFSLPDNIDRVVRVLPPIDFDPLPPELSIYSWIIQAFYPMVGNFIPDEPLNFIEDDWFEDKNDSIASLYRKLHQAATIGWTTGLLKNQLGKDAAEFLMWQEQQQVHWQQLQKMWHNFIDRLLQTAEKSDNRDGYPLSPDCLIVLPIDDLDLQVARTRELLLALRVLRHNRLIYLLTGHTGNTDLALTASFYREFIGNTSNWTDEDLDVIWESSTKLGPPLRDKTIPSSQIFEIKRVEIKDALEWIPPVHQKLQRENHTENLKVILNKLSICDKENSKLGNFLASRSAEERLSPKLIFRKLQSFSDKWSGQTDSSIHGVADFLKVALEDPLEKVLFVDVEQRAGARFDLIIKLTGEFSQSAAVSANIEEIDEEASRIKWFTQLDFYQKSDRGQATVGSDDNEFHSIDSASPNYLLAYDLAFEYSNQIEIDRNIKFIGCPLGFVWAEFPIEEKTCLVTWPMLRQPNSPSQMFKIHQNWIAMLDECQTRGGGITYESIKDTWCKFNEISNNEEIAEFTSYLDVLTHGGGQSSIKNLLTLIDSYSTINAGTNLLKGFSKPRVYVVAVSEDDLDYCELVFRLRSPNTNESQNS